MKRTALIIIIILLLGLGLTAYLMYTHEMPDQVSKDPDYSLTAKELLTDFETDVTTASRKYIDKIIEFSGVLKSIDTSGSIILGAPEKPGEIIMAIDPRHKKALAGNSTGDVVTVQGICSSYSKDEASPDDLLAGLGATLRFRSGGIKTPDK
ncbi:MAG: hypothetical protein EOP51_24820 [Sphingobacteriales bacterium]|nr:MAG: hypothetical protein EOP51_24820 [Sphingobacteriales bacterium]